MGMNEIWKDIEGYEGYYQVSNLGRVKSLERRVPVKNGYFRVKKMAFKKEQRINSGYMIVNLSRGFIKNHLIHRLVASAFIPNPHNLETVNHINGVKTDNIVSNLEWNSYSQNLSHALATGLRKPKNRALTETEALTAVTIMSVKKRSGASLSRVFNVSKSTMDRIRNRQVWKHIPWPSIEL